MLVEDCRSLYPPKPCAIDIPQLHRLASGLKPKTCCATWTEPGAFKPILKDPQLDLHQRH